MNKKIIFVLCLFTVFLLSFSVISAANNDSTTKTKITASKDNSAIDGSQIKTKSTKNVLKKNFENSKSSVKEKAITNTTRVKTSKELTNSFTESQSNATTKTINLKKGTYRISSPIKLDTQSYKTIVVNGNGATLTGNNKNQFLNISKGFTVTLNRLTIKNFRSKERGGAIDNAGKLTINDCTFKNNKVLHQKREVVYDRTTKDDEYLFASSDADNSKEDEASVYGNEKDFYLAKGAAIFNNGTLKINNGIFRNNTFNKINYHQFDYYEKSVDWEASGGAIFNMADAVIKNSNFASNWAMTGGAINNRKKLTVIKSTFKSNYADDYGGSIYNARDMTILSSNFIDNYAILGGAIDNVENSFITNSTFKKNKAIHGGAIFIDSVKDKSNIRSTFLNNKATYDGGAIYIRNIKGTTNINGVFKNNQAEDLGGALLICGNKVNIKGTFINNTANGDYGLVKNKAKSTKVTCSPKSNKNSVYGGAIYNEAGKSKINIKSSTKKLSATKIIVSNTVTKYANKVKKSLTVKTKDNKKVTGGIITLYVNGKYATKANVKDGKANITIGKYNAGYYKLKYKYTHPVLKTSIKKSKLTVKKLKASIALTAATLKKGKSTKKTVTIKSGNKAVKQGTVKIYINNKIYKTLKVKNGKVTFKTPLKPVGTYTMKAVFTSKNYKTAKKSAKLIIKSSNTGYKVITLPVKTDGSYYQRVVGPVEFETWYAEGYGADGPAAGVRVWDYYSYDPMNSVPEYGLIKAKFYYKNSKGKITTRTTTDGNLLARFGDVISGYKAFKVDAYYRKLTDMEYDGLSSSFYPSNNYSSGFSGSSSSSYSSSSGSSESYY